jgi:hypothetical protein
MTVGIAYSSGTYGTYLEWCLTTLTSKGKIVAPFNANGDSHRFKGNFIRNIFDQTNSVELTKNLNFFRALPKYKKEHSLSKNLFDMCELTKSLIYLYPDKSSILLCINNIHEKIYDNRFEYYFYNTQFEYCGIDQNEIYKNWPVDSNLKLHQIPRWIQREFFSFYLIPTWFDQIEWYHLDTWQHEKCQVITVRELLWDFEKTLNCCRDFCGLEYTRPITDLLELHQQNLQNQQHLNEDVLCHTIVNSTVEDKNFSWLPRSLVSEAWIQWQLRTLGWEIRCDGLDTFPTNSVHLKELLYNI